MTGRVDHLHWPELFAAAQEAINRARRMVSNVQIVANLKMIGESYIFLCFVGIAAPRV